MSDLYSLPTAELIARLHSGETTSRALVEHSLARIAELNPTINAFVSTDEEAALTAADAIDARRAAGESLGLLQGLPLGLKDNICRQGTATTCGSRMLNNFQPPYDAHVVERIQAEDGIVIGKLNLDEFAMGSTTETSFHGVTRNPANTDHTPGGSSGGSAAAVAAGMVPLALGSDTGGSIRQPASFCGVVGLKPTYGRVSRYGLVAFASSLDQIGPLAKDTYGAALLLQTIAGHDQRDSTSVNHPVDNYITAATTSRENLRIGVVKDHYTDGLSDDVRAAIESQLEAYKAAGATLVDIELPHAKYAVATYYLIAPSEASSNLARYDGIHYGHRSEQFDPATDNLVDLYCQSRAEGFGPEVKRRIMLGTYALSAGYYDAYYLKALKVRRRIREDFDKAFQNVDVIAGPVAPSTAFPIGDKADDPLALYLSDIYTLSANLAGIPGISIPLAAAPSGLPIGLQLQAPAFAESTLLAAACSCD